MGRLSASFIDSGALGSIAGFSEKRFQPQHPAGPMAPLVSPKQSFIWFITEEKIDAAIAAVRTITEE